MVNCKYTYFGTNGTNEFASFTELLNFVDSRPIEELSGDDTVFSKTASNSKSELMYNRLRALNKEYSIAKPSESHTSLINGEPSLKGRDAISILDFIDSPACMVGGNPLITLMDKDEYLNSVVDKLTSGEGAISKEEAVKKVKATLKNWETIQEDGIGLHALFAAVDKFRNDSSDEFINLAYAQDSERLHDITLINNLKSDLKSWYIKTKLADQKLVYNLNMQAKIQKLKQTLIGHVDYISINPDGKLNLYLFKISSTSPKKWSKVKEEKYKYNLVFLKHMLAANGIDSSNISLNIVPVELKYKEAEDFKTIDKIVFHKTRNYNLDSSGKYALSKYDNKVKVFLTPKVVIPEITSDVVKGADEIILNIFPTLNIKSSGVTKSAVDWIKSAPETGDESTPIFIKSIGDPDHSYDLHLRDKVFPIKSSDKKYKNQEIIDIVTDHIKELDDNKHETISMLKSAVEECYNKKNTYNFNKIKGFYNSESFLTSVFSKYLTFHEVADPSDPTKFNKVYDWELLDNLLDCNILLFKNKQTNQIDIISLSAFNLDSEVKIKSGTNNLLGAYKRDSEIDMLSNTYGNLETIRTLVLLNLILPSISPDILLGKVKVISPIGLGMREYNINNINKKYLQNIFKIIKEKNPNLVIKNNLNTAKFEDPIDTLIKEFDDILEFGKIKPEDIVTEEYFDDLKAATSTEAKIIALQNLLEELRSNKSEQDIINSLNNVNISNYTKIKAKLYILASNAYHTLRGEYLNYVKDLNSIDYYIYTAPTVPDENIRIVVNNLITTIDTIAEEVELKYNENIRKIFMDYYKSIGYSAAQNAVIGNQTQQFENLYELDSKGVKTMRFKNPYTDGSLSEAEKKLIKQVTFQFEKIRFGDKFTISSWEDQDAVEQYIKRRPNYLDVPLQRACSASKKQNKARYKNMLKNLVKISTHSKEWYDEFVENLVPEERDLLEQDINTLQLTNFFQKQREPNVRALLLSEHGADYFETNLENLLIDFTAKYIEVEQMNKFLIGTKSLLLQMYLMRENAGEASKKVIDKEIKYIQDYLKKNVYKRSIMEKPLEKATGFLAPFRSVVTNINLAGNVVSFFRDNMQGFAENFMRSIIKFQTDLTMEDVTKAYAYVVPNSLSNAMNVTILSKLCVKYRLSNTDLARISERLKSGRGGVFNADNWAYATLRTPDFLNRMVLFVARCMHDGCWEAYSLKDDVLIYDWKKDKRFNIFALGDIHNPEYNKLKALYFSKIREYNLEHPEAPLEFTDDLPVPYSDKEILSIKNVSNNIYGSYDKSLKAMGEHHFLGWMFGMYTTWMNGIWNNYFLKPGNYNISERSLEQETDDNGNLLFFDSDGNITTEDTGVPVYKHVPIIVQGIWYTLKDMFYILKDDGTDSFKKYLQSNKGALLNMKKALSDLLISLLNMCILKLLFDPKYKDYKKTAYQNTIVLNLVVEILYKSSSRSLDSFQGPLNIIQYFGENMNPPMYQVPVKLITDTGKWLFGDKTFMQLTTGNFAIMRSYLDTYNAYRKAHKND